MNGPLGQLIHENTKTVSPTTKKNTKRLYNYAKSKQKTSKTISAIRDPNEATTNSTAEISNILNLYFKSVFVEEDSTSPMSEFISRTSQRIEEVSLNVADISTRLGALDQHIGRPIMIIT